MTTENLATHLDRYRGWLAAAEDLVGDCLDAAAREEKPDQRALGATVLNLRRVIDARRVICAWEKELDREAAPACDHPPDRAADLALLMRIAEEELPTDEDDEGDEE